MKVEIVEWHAFSTWHWDIPGTGYEDELCGICRVSFDGTCPNCKYPGDGCPIVLGLGCSHNFHLHCIMKWLEQDTSKGLCPMCRQIFLFKEGTFGAEDGKKLQRLVDGHKATRERGPNESDQEFEAFDGQQVE
ncbi:anaphase promoting complex subunit 11 [Suhomyces tanzawaensis NRRL Y-17324]|uniref:Anaphase-promoting complex subunit 11 n=1 Tax=Suhomyces tanzawaensis NRRL Y-17324 TaxID=984487 RepID=A0A1E4SJ68_9ASCO|nr:anaphase promoting complex subunit 11 [Suhomyces tanzawaensis NRRL Y-17324]ODV79549.1 anaphase promoting complex subunit 11 [Suhomyces tanzawaensis NRRL Y-17324]